MIKLECPFPQAKISIIDDDAENIRYIKSILEWAGYSSYIGITDSKSALTTLANYHPDIVILDMHMPAPNGHEILRAIREDLFPGQYLPVIALTGDTSSDTKTQALHAGASDFLVKPADALEILLRIRNLLEARQMHVSLGHYREHLEQVVQARTSELKATNRGALEALARAAEFRDDETGEHTKRVGDLSARIAVGLYLETTLVDAIRLTAPLHDVGKIAVPDNILLKPGKLDIAEFEMVKLHTTVGAKLLSIIHSPEMELAKSIALSHHEKWDGSGYPEGLVGDQIPLPARIVAVADVYDALTHERPYKKAWSHDQATDEIHSLSGRNFDPTVVKAFLQI